MFKYPGYLRVRINSVPYPVKKNTEYIMLSDNIKPISKSLM